MKEKITALIFVLTWCFFANATNNHTNNTLSKCNTEKTRIMRIQEEIIKLHQRLHTSTGINGALFSIVALGAFFLGFVECAMSNQCAPSSFMSEGFILLIAIPSIIYNFHTSKKEGKKLEDLTGSPV